MHQNSPKAGRPIEFVAWMIGERLLRGVASAIVFGLVARHLQPSGFGALNLAWTIVNVVMPFAQFGLESFAVRELLRRPGERGAILATSAGLRFGLGLVCAIGVVGVTFSSDAFSAARTAIVPVSLLLLIQSMEVTDFWFRAHVQSRAVAIARFTAVCLGIVVRLLLLASGAGIAAFAWTLAGEAAAFVIILFALYGKARPADERWRWDSTVAKDLAVNAWAFAVSALLASLAMRVDQLAVALWKGPSVAAGYFAALKLIELPVFVATATATSLFPRLARSALGPREKWPVSAEESFTVLSALGWLAAIGTTVAGPWVLTALCGKQYADATPALLIHGWACLLLFSALVRAQILAAHGHALAQLVTMVFTLVAQLALNALLVPPYAATGAALAFLLSQLAAAWLLPWFMPALRPYLGAQFRGLLLPLNPRTWRAMLARMQHT